MALSHVYVILLKLNSNFVNVIFVKDNLNEKRSLNEQEKRFHPSKFLLLLIEYIFLVL